MMIQGNQTISDILFQRPCFLHVLERFGFGIRADQTVDRICEDSGIHHDLVLTIANLYCTQLSLEFNYEIFNKRDLEAVLTYLKNSHIYFLEEKLPRLTQMMNDKIKSTPDENYALLIKKFLDDYFSEVLEHIGYENNIVFPYVVSLIHENEQSTGYLIEKFKAHHTDIEMKLEDLKNLLIRHMPQDYDFTLRRRMLFELFDLEHDIAVHDFIENHLLIPLVEKLENRNE